MTSDNARHHQAAWFKTSSILLPFLLILALLPGCTQEPQLKFDSAYQAVFLDNGQVFFGKLEQGGSPFPILKDVFYVQRITEDKKEPRNVLVKRGSEWHGPDFMRLNARHIVVIEPVSPESRVAQLIKEAKAVKPEGTKP